MTLKLSCRITLLKYRSETLFSTFRFRNREKLCNYISFHILTPFCRNWYSIFLNMLISGIRTPLYVIGKYRKLFYLNIKFSIQSDISCLLLLWHFVKKHVFVKLFFVNKINASNKSCLKKHHLFGLIPIFLRFQFVFLHNST